MKSIPKETQIKAKRLRQLGRSHREIAEEFGVSLGSAFKYTKEIQLTPEQHLELKRRNFKHIQKLNSSKLKEAQKRGGRNTPSKFEPKYSREDLTKEIKKFAKKYGRPPMKREFVAKYRSFIRVFGSWNNAIKTAGLEPNPVKFAKKFVANDGHKCDSLSEKIVDDWLNAREIKHRINVPYPKNSKLTADFVVKNYWIEFFGLSGEHKRYDELKEQKIKIAKDHSLNLIAIYPEDLFPEFKLEKNLKVLLNKTERGRDGIRFNPSK